MINKNELAVVKKNLREALALVVDKRYLDFTQKYLGEEYNTSDNDFFFWLKDYCVGGKTEECVTMPPDEAFDRENMCITELAARPNCYHLAFDLWIDGTQSDITLECTFDFTGAAPKFTFDDLHVL